MGGWGWGGGGGGLIWKRASVEDCGFWGTGVVVVVVGRWWVCVGGWGVGGGLEMEKVWWKKWAL